jgi:hypothetical protein
MATIKNVTKSFLGNHKAENYHETVGLSMLTDYNWTLKRCSTGDTQQEVNHSYFLGNVKTH